MRIISTMIQWITFWSCRLKLGQEIVGMIHILKSYQESTLQNILHVCRLHAKENGIWYRSYLKKMVEFWNDSPEYINIFQYLDWLFFMSCAFLFAKRLITQVFQTPTTKIQISFPVTLGFSQSKIAVEKQENSDRDDD